MSGIYIPNVEKEKSCIDCPIWSLCWDEKPNTAQYYSSTKIYACRCPIIPAADVAEVRHGRWIEWDDGEGDTFECSVCGEPWTLNAGTPEENNMHYCPNCGARMEDGK